MNASIKAGQGGIMIVLALILSMMGWSLDAWDPPSAPPPPFSAETVWIEIVSPRGGPVVYAFPHPPEPGDIGKILGDDASVPPEFVVDRPMRVLAGRRTSVHPLSGAVALAIGRKMDLNRADARDMTLLPGIGPAGARRIAGDRDRRGPFSSLADLARVKGIGPWTIENIRPFATAGEDGGRSLN